MRRGIDVSSWQGKIDWKKVKASGVEFAIIRAGFGKATMDQYFEANYAGAKAAGIPVGAYFYSYAKSAAEGKKEAQAFLSWLKGKQFEYPVCLDQESSKLDGVGKKELTEAADAFLSTVQNAGYYVCLYSNPNWLNNRVDKAYLLKKFDLWLAAWPASKQPDMDRSGECGIWQYSNIGKVNGISGNVDLDVAYKDYPSIIKRLGLNGFKKDIDLEKLQQENEGLKSKLKELEIKFANASKQNDELTSKAGDLQAKLQEANAKVLTMESKLKRYTNFFKELGELMKGE